jgi:histidinol-phosphate/aromatic aminotransferase/cobyric acid decarboxylase-like protein
MRYVSIKFLELNVVDLSVLQVKKTINGDPSIMLIFLCSLGNPTGTLISLASIRALLDYYEPFKGVVVVGEAYIDFSKPGSSAVLLMAEYAGHVGVSAYLGAVYLVQDPCVLTAAATIVTAPVPL